jgi:hypothetical protein
MVSQVPGCIEALKGAFPLEIFFAEKKTPRCCGFERTEITI